MSPYETKTCAVCGRLMTPRAAWARTWASVRYCGRRCRRRRRPASVDTALEGAIIDLLRSRARSATICPSEAARAVRPDGDTWRSLTERSREAARRLVARGRVEIVQGGRVVYPSAARGAIRIRRAAGFEGERER